MTPTPSVDPRDPTGPQERHDGFCSRATRPTGFPGYRIPHCPPGNFSYLRTRKELMADPLSFLFECDSGRIRAPATNPAPMWVREYRSRRELPVGRRAGHRPPTLRRAPTLVAKPVHWRVGSPSDPARHCAADAAMRSRNSPRSRCSSRLSRIHDFPTETRPRRGARRSARYRPFSSPST